MIVSCASGKEAPIAVQWRVDLWEHERQQLETFIRSGSALVREVKRAQILLAADAGKMDEEISSTLSVGTSTVFRAKRRSWREGSSASAQEGAQALAAQDVVHPEGRRRVRGADGGRARSLRARPEHTAGCTDGAGRVLRRVAGADHRRDAYAAAGRAAQDGRPGKPKRQDSEYERNGTANLFVVMDAHRPWRHDEAHPRVSEAPAARRSSGQTVNHQSWSRT
ncbi:MAG: helix-turn-helix domain-containing protein [Deltaproteobacteria bacterium]|nr:helix-turn-helix domain-containing protein [Deltaproteobacteria bacterium]